ncbi:MAG TPA: hypothetical protein DCM05_18255 [Elusimicrobia bacterium]|nr:hypothetical protein [Elusimicrobiota bacterium]
MDRARLRLEAVLLGLCAALCLASLGAYYVGFFNDDAFYLVGARSLLGGSFTELSHPAQPPLSAYLPGYPLLLAPLVGLFPNSVLPCQLLSIALTLGAVLLAFRLLGEAAAVGLFALSPLALSLSGTVLSDPAYLFLTMLLLAAVRAAWKEEGLRRWVPSCLLASFAFYLRPVGAAFPIALAAALFLEKRRREALFCAALCAALILPWLLRNALLGGSGLPYAGELVSGLNVSTLWVNSAFYARELFARALFRWPNAAPGGALEAATAAACLMLSAWGAWRERPSRFLTLYLGLYAAVHLLWPKVSGRYLLPVLPFAAATLVFGAEDLAERFGVRRGRTSLAMLALGAVLFAPTWWKIASAARLKGTPLTTPPKVYEWIRRETPPGAVFAAESDGRLFLLTGRRALRLRGALPRGADYALVLPTGDAIRTRSGRDAHDPLPARAARALFEAAGAEKVFEDPSEGSAVYRLRG